MLKPTPLITFMVDVEDSRKNPNQCEHKLIDILMIALCCIMSNGETWEDMEFYGNKKFKWLKTFLELPKKKRTPTNLTVIVEFVGVLFLFFFFSFFF